MEKFEKRIIDPILNTIKEHQVFLTKKENLPQLAKLGYMYNALWYAGRFASYEGVIEKETIIEEDGEVCEWNQCDDNPKYKIEMCEPEDDEIENYIYDAWGMHVLNDFGPHWDEFSTIVLHGKPLSNIEQKMLKPQKTFDEWVEILTDPDYRYSSLYQNRRSVANNLLCTIGNGYGFKDGFVMYEASGADQDSTDYGDWMNAKFREDIQLIVDKIMVDPEVEKVIRATEEADKKHKAEQLAKEIKSFGMPFDDYIKSDGYKDVNRKFAELRGEVYIEEEEKYNAYYPICNYSIITMIEKDSHPSYIKAAVEVCEDILAHKEIENKERKGNVSFAERFLKLYNNNFVEVKDEWAITLSDEELKVKIQQVKSSFSVEGIPLIKSDRFTQEEYDAMIAKSDAHNSHFTHLKVGAKVWSDKVIGEQIRTFICQNQITERQLQKYVDSLYENCSYVDYDEDLKVFKASLYEKLGWDKLKPINSKFWGRFGSAPMSMVHNHKNIGEVEKGYGAVGMDDIFGDAFNFSYHLVYGVGNILYGFKDGWDNKKLSK